MSLISERIVRDVEATYSRRPASVGLAHWALDKAALLAIDAAARLSPLTDRLPAPVRDFVHDIPVSLLKRSAMARADCAGGRDMPSLEALRETVLGFLRGGSPAAGSGDCASCAAGGLCEAHDELGYRWYAFAEEAAVLQFSLLYFDRVNSAWVGFRARWGGRFITRGPGGNLVSMQGSLANAISNAARDGVWVAACASERFLSEYKWLAERDVGRRELLEDIKRRYEAPELVAAWAAVLPAGLLERVCGLD